MVQQEESIFTVDLFGQTFRFKQDASDGDPQEILEILYREVRKIENAHRGSAVYGNKMALLIMAALNVCQEVLDLRMEKEQILKDVENHSQHVLQLLEAHIQGNDGLLELPPLSCTRLEETL